MNVINTAVTRMVKMRRVFFWFIYMLLSRLYCTAEKVIIKALRLFFRKHSVQPRFLAGYENIHLLIGFCGVVEVRGSHAFLQSVSRPSKIQKNVIPPGSFGVCRDEWRRSAFVQKVRKRLPRCLKLRIRFLHVL